MRKAIVLCSGGLDSVVLSHYVKKKLKYKKILILFFNYGQKSLLPERKYSKLCALEIGADFKELKISELAKLSTSLINLPGKSEISRKSLKNTKKESEKWYVPCRNLIFLSYALALADSLKIKENIVYDIFIGFKNEGSEPYPDTTKEFLNSINNISKKMKLKNKIYSPLINKDKEDIIKLGNKLRVDFKKTFSCYIGNKAHCGKCLACMLRKEGFYWANIQDQTIYHDP